MEGPLTFITPFLHMEVPAFLITNKSLGHGGELYTGKVERRFVLYHPCVKTPIQGWSTHRVGEGKTENA
jgi:hypothetical protein